MEILVMWLVIPLALGIVVITAVPKFLTAVAGVIPSTLSANTLRFLQWYLVGLFLMAALWAINMGLKAAKQKEVV